MVLPRPDPENIDSLVTTTGLIADPFCTSTDGVGYYLRMHAGNGEARLPDEQASLVVEVFRMLADATRVQVL